MEQEGEQKGLHGGRRPAGLQEEGEKKMDEEEEREVEEVVLVEK